MKRDELIIFIRRLSFLVGAHISLEKAVALVAKQSRPRFRKYVVDIHDALIHGTSFSESLEQFPKIFPTFVTRIIRAGEAHGLLAECLSYTSSELERRKILVKKIISMSVYPCLIAIGTIVLSGFLLLFIFPKIRGVFTSLHMSLPFATRVTLWISDTLRAYGIYMFSSLVVIGIALVYFLRTSSKFQYQKDRLIIRIPLIGTLVRYSYNSAFLRMTGIMLEAHISIDKAVLYSGEAIHHQEFQTAIKHVSSILGERGNLKDGLSQYPHLFPDITCELVEVGESSGTLSKSLIFISDMYDKEIEDKLKILMTLLEPALMILMGIIVGFISLSIITPMYEVSQTISR